MTEIFQTFLVQPIVNLLIWLYNILPGGDLGFAIIALTFIVKIILYPFTMAQIKQQRALQEIQPKIEEIRARLKDDKEAQAKELMDLYRREKVNPASSCLPLLIPLPIFIGLFQALRDSLASRGLNLLYPFVANPGSINHVFLGLIDLSQPSPALAVIAGGIQFVQSWQMMKKPSPAAPPPPDVAKTPGAKDEGMAAMMNKQMMYIMPIMTVVIGFSLPGGLALYWGVMSALTVAQQAFLLRRPIPPAATAHLA